MKISKSELQELVREAIDEYRAINEISSLSQLLSSDEKKEILDIANQYRQEINNEIKENKNSEEYYHKDKNGYSFRFNGIKDIQLNFFKHYNKFGLYIDAGYYDPYFNKTYEKVFDIIFNKIKSNNTLSKKYDFTKEKKLILIDFKEKEKNDIINMNKSEYDRILKIIQTEFNYNDKSKLQNWNNKELIDSIKKEINTNEYLTEENKKYLRYNLNYRIEECKKYFEKFNTSSNKTNNHKKIFDELGKRLKESGYPSSKKTWWTEGYDYEGEEDGYFFFVAYDENYSGTGSDYDNGLTKADKAKNEQFVKKLVEIIKQLRSEFKCSIDYDIYRGHGTVTVSFSK